MSDYQTGAVKDIASRILLLVSCILMDIIFKAELLPFENVHVLPETHFVQPVQFLPPHCSHFAD